jgi:hypothetical protein
MRVIVIGAGIFGVTIALKLSERHDVTLVDANSDIMQNASKVNHNRLHFGFHYPRSKATAKQSLEGYELFYDYFSDAVTSNFPNYYMIEKNSNVSSEYYECFCDGLGLSYKRQYPAVDINFDNIESSYLVREPIFDYDLIKLTLYKDLKNSYVKPILNKRISNKNDMEGYDVIINASYFNVNKINRIFGLPETKLRLQTVIIPIFKYNSGRIGLTIMDGKYCSIMPKGFEPGTFLLYHAKESIVYETESEVIPRLWYCGKQIINNRAIRKAIYDPIIAKHHINRIAEASEKYFRFLKDCDFVDYWQTVRALPINDDDERLSIFDVAEQGSQKIISVLSGKISTCLLTANNISKLI